MEINELTKKVIGYAIIEVHKSLRPGLLEAAYELRSLYNEKFGGEWCGLCDLCVLIRGVGCV